MMIIDKIIKRRSNESNQTTLRVTMMGGRGAGKSSVLASLSKNMNSVLEGTKLYMFPLGESMIVINNKFDELMRMFDNAKLGLEIPSAGIAGDEDVTTYKFSFGMHDTASKMDIEFRDFPGEYIEREPDVVRQFVKDSNALIIAIDTPHLMEEDGKYNEAKNCTEIISKFITDNLNETVANKLLLFVPLKCEKYFHNRQMRLVSEKVQQAYGDLISMLKENYKTTVASAIIPIQTLGDVVFSHFGRDEKGEIVTIQKQNSSLYLPQDAIYMYRNREAKYSPADCEQPLYYLLTFVAKQFESIRNSPPTTFIEILKAKIKGLFKIISDNPDFLLQISRLKSKRLKNVEKGFDILTGKNLI